MELAGEGRAAVVNHYQILAQASACALQMTALLGWQNVDRLSGRAQADACANYSRIIITLFSHSHISP
jgi:hypothetical protein